MAALALLMTACSSNDEELTQQPPKAEGIPFTATISMDNGATTRALTESGGNIEAAWADGEQVALIYDAGGTPTKTEAEVTKQTDGTATISATLESGATDGSDVTIIYPATAADGTTGNVKSDLLAAQNGTLTGTNSIAANYDVRTGTGKLSISAGGATVNNGTAGTPVSLTNQVAIFKFTTKNASSVNINVTSLTVTIGTQQYVITPASATSTLYAALPAVSSQKVTFIAKGSDSKTYWVSKPSVTFAAGKYYQSGIKMSQVTYTSATIGVGTVFHVGDTYYADGTTKNFHAATNFSFINNNGVITLINDGGTYKFQRASNDTKVDLGISVTGNSDGVYIVSGSGTSGSRFEIAVHTN